MKLLILLLLPLMAMGANKYTHPSGSNSNDGSFESPYLTIGYPCSTSLVAGDTLFVRGNIPRENGGFFARYDAGPCNNDLANDYWQSIRCANNGTEGNPVVVMVYPGDSIEVYRSMRGNTGKSYLNALMGCRDNEWVVFDGFTLYTAKDTVTISGATIMSSRHCTIKNFNVYGKNLFPVIATDTNFFNACGYHNHSGIRVEGSRNSCVTDCYVNGFLCYNEELNDCNQNNVCVLFYRDTACTVQYCMIENGCHELRDKQYGSIDNVFINNLLIGGVSKGSGFAVGAQKPQKNAIIRNNIIINGLYGSAEVDRHMQGVKLTNNTFYINSGALSSSLGVIQFTEGYGSCIENEVYNNLFFDSYAQSRYVYQNNFSSSEWHVDNNLFDYCDYNAYSHFRAYQNLHPDQIWTVEQWQNIGNDVNAFYEISDPFVSAESMDFKLKSDSPLRNAGRYGLHVGAYSTDGTVVGPRNREYQDPGIPEDPEPEPSYVDTTGYVYVFTPDKGRRSMSVPIKIKTTTKPVNCYLSDKTGTIVDSLKDANTGDSTSFTATKTGLYYLIKVYKN